MDIGYLQKCPKIVFLREDERIPVRVSKSDQQKLMDAVDHVELRWRSRDWWRNMIRVLFYTGFRRNEILRLKWEDVDLVGGSIKKVAETSKGRRDCFDSCWCSVVGVFEGVGVVSRLVGCVPD